MQQEQHVQGAILAGGLSTRMGRHKATLPLPDGRTMIEHVAAALHAVCGGELLIAYGGSYLAGWATSPWPGAVLLPDLRANAGPLGGIEAILACNKSTQYLVCPCDVPAITPEVLETLLRGSSAAMATVVRIAGREHFEPLPAHISAAALPAVRRLLDGGVRSVWRLMEALPAAIVEIDGAHAAALRNINTPQDLSRA